MINSAKLTLLTVHVLWTFDPNTRDVLEYSKDMHSWFEAIAPYPVQGNDYRVPISTASDRKFFRINRWWGFPKIESSLWPTTLPADGHGADMPVELGLKFRAAVDGYVSGIRFYRTEENVGPHEGHLWSPSGELLATGTFLPQPVGWQELRFSEPVPISRATLYTVSYHCPNGFYSFDSNYFIQPYYNLPLEAAVSVFAYGPPGTFPTQTFRLNNYWVDVIYYPQ